MKGGNDRWTDRGAAAAFAVVLGLSALWGNHDRALYGDKGRAVTQEMQAGMDMASDMSQGSSQREGAAVIPTLEDSQKKVLGEIIDCLKDQDLKQAAQVMEREKEMLQTLFYEVMEGERYLYDGQDLKTLAEGEGMVFTLPGTLYYGTFKNGKPEGKCLALQVVDLESPRYDYSQGMWKHGMMEGEGHTGYCYYEGSPEGEARDICKAGTFSGDLMKGQVTYTTMNEENVTSTWKLEAQEGATVLDDRWDYIEDREEYQLMSEDNDSHAYIISGELAEQPVWKNLLVWEE